MPDPQVLLHGPHGTHAQSLGHGLTLSHTLTSFPEHFFPPLWADGTSFLLCTLRPQLLLHDPHELHLHGQGLVLQILELFPERGIPP